MNGQLAASDALVRFRRGSGMAAIGGAGLCLIGLLLNHEQFLRSYLLGFLLWIGIALGAFAILMIHHLTGGGWGQIIRPFMESATRTLPLFALLFIPVILGLGSLYLWANPQAVADDELLQHKTGYLNKWFFIGRSAIYFAVWIGVAFWLMRTRLSTKAPHDGDERARRICGPGLLLYGLTATFASVDWVMSLEPHWYSTIYGLSFAVGQVLSGFAFAIIVVVVLSRGGLSAERDAARLHDLGNLLLTFVMLWAYMALSQYLIIWSGNLPGEIEWYLHRTSSGWRAVAVVLIVFHFAVPFLLLLSRQIKRKALALASVAAGIVAFRLVDLFWFTAPAFLGGSFAVHWLDLVVPGTLGALWLSVFMHLHLRRKAANGAGAGAVEGDLA